MTAIGTNRHSEAPDVFQRFGIDTFVGGTITRRFRRGPARAIVRSCWTLDYTLCAGARCRVGSQDAPWRSRDAYVAHLYGPNVPYWEDARAMELPGSSLWICFGGGGIWGLGHLLGTGSSHAVFVDPDHLLYDLLRETMAFWTTCYLADSSRGWRVLSSFLGIVDLLQTAKPLGGRSFRIVSPDAGLAPGFCERVDRLLTRNLDRTITLGELARGLGVSKSTLSHRFREETGTTPLRRHTELRLRKATGMLAAGEPLKRIADQLGFCDVPHLSNVFRRQLGCSPREWRQVSGR